MQSNFQAAKPAPFCTTNEETTVMILNQQLSNCSPDLDERG